MPNPGLQQEAERAWANYWTPPFTNDYECFLAGYVAAAGSRDQRIEALHRLVDELEASQF